MLAKNMPTLMCHDTAYLVDRHLLYDTTADSNESVGLAISISIHLWIIIDVEFWHTDAHLPNNTSEKQINLWEVAFADLQHKAKILTSEGLLVAIFHHPTNQVVKAFQFL